MCTWAYLGTSSLVTLMVGPVRGDTGHRRLQTRHSRNGSLILGQTGHCQAEDAALAAGKGNDKTLVTD